MTVVSTNTIKVDMVDIIRSVSLYRHSAAQGRPTTHGRVKVLRLQLEESFLQFFSVALVIFSDQNENSHNY